ncbi:MAG: polysaccharide deacetylase family protein, partial [Bacteroidales bacterium]|nr:polysaccharide deacetylase family protein [Bacteroidales bacterium]
MRFFRPFFAARWIYRNAVFRIAAGEKTVCLTFDDGPAPESTPHIVSLLKRHNVKAMFFFSGNRAERHRDIVKQVTCHGHIVGNHGFHHIDGWASSCGKYI